MKTQKCGACGAEMIPRMATAEAPYRYTLSGLSDIGLVGIVVRACPQCERESPIIPRIEELHHVIAMDLARKPGLLRGEEIKFLRKHADMPAKEFARLIGVGPEHLSRVENRRIETLGEPSDKLVRLCAMAIAHDGEAARAILMEMAEREDPPRKPPQAAKNVYRIEQRKGKGWRAA
jgi:DNA-binding transcriptional regulator YiaG